MKIFKICAEVIVSKFDYPFNIFTNVLTGQYENLNP